MVPQPAGGPLPSMNDGSVALHELYSSHVRAGFSKDQALKLVMHQLSISSEDQRERDLRGRGL